MKQIVIICLIVLAVFNSAVHAEIYQWEYINPAAPTQGKKQSNILCPDGAGINAVLLADLSNRNLSKAYLFGADMRGVSLENSNLRDALLTSTRLVRANVFGTDFTGADIRGAIFGPAYNYVGHKLTLAQIYSTGSYQDHDLNGISLFENNLTGANFASLNLTGAALDGCNLIGAHLQNANLTNTYFGTANVTGADFTGADIRGAVFDRTPDITDGTQFLVPAQICSTASYATHDLSGVRLRGIDLTNMNFTGQNLANAEFYESALTGANFSGAIIRGANFTAAKITPAQLYATASYQAHDLTGVTLRITNWGGANFVGQSLAHSDLSSAGFTGADLSLANLTGANLSASSLLNANLHGADLSTAIVVGANLSGANLSNADAINANFANSTFAGANLNGADLRGSTFSYSNLASTVTTNFIGPFGVISDVELSDGQQLVIRDYNGDPSKNTVGPKIPISIANNSVNHFLMGRGGMLQLVFDADDWGSTISFGFFTTVTLGGTLDLQFAPGVNVAGQVGRTIKVFDWTIISPGTGVPSIKSKTGSFAISSPYAWDLSRLYDTGEVTLRSVPEPSTFVMLMLAAAGWCLCHRRRA